MSTAKERDTIPAPPPEGRASIVLAEDDFALRAIVASQLRASGYDVVETRNGSELLNYLANTMAFGARYERPDVVISDVRMPGATGFEVIQGLRQARLRTKVIFMTAFGSPSAYERAASLGARMIDKPFDIDELIGLVGITLADEASSAENSRPMPTNRQDLSK